MSGPTHNPHDARIIEQFSKQAASLASDAHLAQSIELLIQMSGVGPADTVLDVACGPGVVACEFARRARHVTGIDITEKMIVEARQRQAKNLLANLSWQVGRVDPLPYGDGTFSCVITRYTFHHFAQPEAVLREMVRVCRPGGRVLVADLSGRPAHMDAINRVERLRDPSHVRLLSADLHAAMFAAAGLTDLTRNTYRLHIDLEEQLARSFPNPGDDEKVRRIYADDIGRNGLGLDARREEGRIVFEYTVNVCVGKKPEGSGRDTCTTQF